MKKAAIYGAVAIVSVVAIGAWVLRDNDVTPLIAPLSGSNERAIELSYEQSASRDPSLNTSTAAIGAMAQAEPELNQADDDASEDPAKMFAADAAGNLILQERTRLNIEKLLWLYSPAEYQEKVAAVDQSLPAPAQRQFRDLLEQYKTFTAAARQAYPPGVAPATVEDAIVLNEGLSALRKAHFGAEGAERMFGREERINRRLLDFMSLEKHEGFTMEEKTQKAQQMLSRSPELLAAYANNRKTDQQASKN